jgi:hypothetical protein
VIELRKTKRFDMKLPVEVVRRSFHPVSGFGQTKNISAGGVLFDANIEVEVGEPLEYIITFPSHPMNGGSVNLRCLGKVVRAEPTSGGPDGHGTLVAATLERYEFVRREDEKH